VGRGDDAQFGIWRKREEEAVRMHGIEMEGREGLFILGVGAVMEA
jgi:hypothetical protein